MTKEVSEQEKKDKRFSMIVSAIVHTSLLVLLIFLVAWRMPDPPPEEYGMELNIGVDEQGSGDVDSDLDDSPEETENETPPESENDTEEVQEETVDETPVEEPVEEVEPITEPVEEVQEVVEEVTEPVETPAEEVVDPVETQETESDVKVEEEKKEEVKEEEKKEEVKPVEEEKKPVEPKPKPKPVVNDRALLGSKKSDTDSKEAAASNQGKTDERGQMGKPEGKKNTDGQVPGGADIGVSLSLDGWKWDRPPADKDDSQIDGIIKFSIQVDDRGDVMSVTKMPGTTISDNNVVAFYKRQVEKLIFIRTDNSKAASAISKGEITFVLKTK